MRMLLQKRFQLITKRLSPWIRPFDYPSLLPELVSTFSVVSKGTVIRVVTLDRFGFKKVKIALKHFWSETFIKTIQNIIWSQERVVTYFLYTIIAILMEFSLILIYLPIELSLYRISTPLFFTILNWLRRECLKYYSF